MGPPIGESNLQNQVLFNAFQVWVTTVDGRNPKQPEMVLKPCNGTWDGAKTL